MNTAPAALLVATNDAVLTMHTANADDLLAGLRGQAVAANCLGVADAVNDMRRIVLAAQRGTYADQRAAVELARQGLRAMAALATNS
jgi:hypothetical protein